LRPEFSVYLENEQQTISLVNDVADVLESISVNSAHTPALYAAFLKALISAKTDPSAPAEANASTSTDATANSLHSNGIISGTSMQYGEASSGFPVEFSFEGEMGPVVDMSTFPPTMGPNPVEETNSGMPMDSILSSDFWDSVLVPGKSPSVLMSSMTLTNIASAGFNSMDGLSGGFVFGAGGSGLITPRFGATPLHSGQNTPMKGSSQNDLSLDLSAVFDQQEASNSGLDI